MQKKEEIKVKKLQKWFGSPSCPEPTKGYKGLPNLIKDEFKIQEPITTNILQY